MGKIIWLASYPKSGNTWLRAFLHNYLRNPKEPYNINQLTDFTLSDSQMSWFNMFDPRPGDQITLEQIAALRPKVHEAMTRAFPDSVFVKTHNALVEDRGTPMITMSCTAGAIYVVRNPLDVVISHADHYGLTVEDSIKAINTPGLRGENDRIHCYELHGSWSEHVLSWTRHPSPALHVVRYEDMLEQPRKTFAGVVQFLRLPPSRERLERAIKLSSFRVLQEQEKRHGFRERSAHSQRFFRAGKAGQWRRVLSPAQVEAVVSMHREQMARFGYWPLPAGAASGAERPALQDGGAAEG
ncbi:MAG: sulfotransferase domain-containing protein [Rhodospirillaceae bacterium]|nr:sulfotransferase domain-containing protein [Rhodospirillaceae bacterium]